MIKKHTFLILFTVLFSCNYDLPEEFDNVNFNYDSVLINCDTNFYQVCKALDENNIVFGYNDYLFSINKNDSIKNANDAYLGFKISKEDKIIEYKDYFFVLFKDNYFHNLYHHKGSLFILKYEDGNMKYEKVAVSVKDITIFKDIVFILYENSLFFLNNSTKLDLYFNNEINVLFITIFNQVLNANPPMYKKYSHINSVSQENSTLIINLAYENKTYENIDIKVKNY